MRYKIAITSLLLGLMCQAAEVARNVPSITYSLPRTEASAEVQYDYVEQHRGMFYQYAERYLGKVEIITEDSKHYVLRDIKLTTQAVADPEKTYVLAAKKSTPKLTLSERGLLLAIGEVEPTAKKAKKADEIKEKRAEKPQPAPLLVEEQLRAGSIAKMAENTAKLIYRIREERLNLLTGETSVADGEALKVMLRRLDAEEQRLTELFVGTTVRSPMRGTVLCDVEHDAEHIVLFRFSALEGLVEADDLSGEPVYVDVKTQKTTYSSQKKEAKPAKEAIYYNLPGQATVAVYDSHRRYVDATLQVAQNGVVVPLSGNDVKSGRTIILDGQTGNIRQIKGTSKN